MRLYSGFPPVNRGKVIVWGMLASYPFGGMTWQALHYIAGLRRLGFDVWYVEDTEGDLLDPETYWSTSDYSANVEFLARYMESIGLGDRWVFRPPYRFDVCLGALNSAGLEQLYREADVAVNVCGYHSLRPEHDVIRKLVYLQTDPMAEQVKVANGDHDVIQRLGAYDLLFTYGENLGEPDCLVPTAGYEWRPTRPPVCLDWWWTTGELPAAGAAFTTVSNWEHWDNAVVWQGETYHWRKDREFRRFLEVPLRSQFPLELCLDGIDDVQSAELRSHGWRITSATDLRNPFAYRQYIRGSLGEFTVAKDQYVRPRTGWFSDRSVCYLAAGLPVITQETGFSRFVPAGRGLFSFETADEILAALDAVRSDYAGNSRAAQEIAAEYFSAEKVIESLMERVGY